MMTFHWSEVDFMVLSVPFATLLVLSIIVSHLPSKWQERVDKAWDWVKG